jgi:uncharacterized protein YaaQ
MKLILAIVRDTDSESVVQALTASDLRVTRVASTGGLLRRGMVTLLIGVEPSRVEETLEIVRTRCAPAPAGQKRGAIFVIPVEQFVQL